MHDSDSYPISVILYGNWIKGKLQRRGEYVMTPSEENDFYLLLKAHNNHKRSVTVAFYNSRSLQDCNFFVGPMRNK